MTAGWWFSWNMICGEYMDNIWILYGYCMDNLYIYIYTLVGGDWNMAVIVLLILGIINHPN